MKLGGAPLGGGGDALAEVVGGAQASAARVCSCAVAARHALGEVAAHRLADRQHRRAAPTPRSPPRTRVRPRADRRRARAGRRGRCAAPPRRARRRAVYMSSSARCCPTTAGRVTEMPKPWWNPSRGEVAAEAGLGRRDAEVGCEREPEPAADGRALHRGDDRLAVGEEAHRLVRRAWRCCRSRRCRSGRRRRRSSCPPSTARCARHSGSSSRPSTASARRGHHLEVEPVVRRPVDLDGGDVVGEVDGDGRRAAHGPRTLPHRRRGPARWSRLCGRPDAWPPAAACLTKP